MFASLFLAVINRLLRDAGWARATLSRYSGRPVRIALPAFSFDFAPDADGYCRPSSADQPEVILTFPADAPWRLLRGWQAVLAAAHIAGNAEYARALADVFRQLQWDVEEDLARLFGDVVAHRLYLALRHGQRQAAEFVTRAAANVAEYLAHESRLLVGQAEFDEHRLAVNALDLRLNQFDHRLRKLSATTQRRSP